MIVTVPRDLGGAVLIYATVAYPESARKASEAKRALHSWLTREYDKATGSRNKRLQWTRELMSARDTGRAMDRFDERLKDREEAVNTAIRLALTKTDEQRPNDSIRIRVGAGNTPSQTARLRIPDRPDQWLTRIWRPSLPVLAISLALRSAMLPRGWRFDLAGTLLHWEEWLDHIVQRTDDYHVLLDRSCIYSNAKTPVEPVFLALAEKCADSVSREDSPAR